MDGFCRRMSALLVEVFTSGTFSMSPCKRSNPPTPDGNARNLGLADALYAYYGLICFDLPCVLVRYSAITVSLRGRLRSAVKLFAALSLTRFQAFNGESFRFLMFWLLSTACHMIPNWFFSKMMCGGSRSRISPTRLKLARRPLKKSPQAKESARFIRDLYEKGNLTQAEFDTAASLNAPGAASLFKRACVAVVKTGIWEWASRPIPLEGTRPHPLIAEAETQEACTKRL